jgi:hypothetical protein
LMHDVMERAGRNNAAALRILAAAYAECGRFSEAIETAKEGLQLAVAQGSSTFANALREDIIAYQKGIPLRDHNLADMQPQPDQR